MEEEKNKHKYLINNPEINKIIDDLHLTLHSLNYTKNEIKNIMPIIIKETDAITNREKNISFENILMLAMNHLDNKSSNID